MLEYGPVIPWEEGQLLLLDCESSLSIALLNASIVSFRHRACQSFENTKSFYESGENGQEKRLD